jgi:hypothetical protein
MSRRLGLGTNQEVVDGAIQQLNIKLDVYDGILGKQAYLAGDVSSSSSLRPLIPFFGDVPKFSLSIFLILSGLAFFFARYLGSPLALVFRCYPRFYRVVVSPGFLTHVLHLSIAFIFFSPKFVLFVLV